MTEAVNHQKRISEALSPAHRELLETFILEHSAFDPIGVQASIGFAIEDVANEHLSAGKDALYQPGKEYSSAELVGFLAKTMFKPEYYEAFKAQLDKEKSEAGWVERAAAKSSSQMER